MYNIDLSRWGIGLPVNDKGKLEGTCVNHYPVPKGFQLKPWFVIEDDGSITFRAPVKGARTSSNTKYVRCELRQLEKNGKKTASKIDKDSALEANLAVRMVPFKKDKTAGRIVIGQIHGPDDELCRMYYDNGQIYFYDDKAGSKKKETRFTLVDIHGSPTNIPLGEYFDYDIIVKDKKLIVNVEHDGKLYSASEPIGSFWKGKGCYYKAGLYLQVDSTGSGEGEVNFRKLELK